MSSTSVDRSLLAKAWTPHLVELEPKSSHSLICRAVERTLPLLVDVASVPFVCRYRTDVIDPLTTKQVHHLQSLISKHSSLESLRSKLMKIISDEAIIERVQTTTSKAELEDLYAPFRPPSKGSILERTQKEHPKLAEAVNQLWSDDDGSVNLSKLGPREPLIHLISSKICAEPQIMVAATDELRRYCRIKTSASDSKYQHYDKFSGHLVHLKDHQVLAIRRGVQQKLVKMSYEIDGDKMERCIKYHLRQGNLAPIQLNRRQDLLKEAVHDAWTRILRRRVTSRLWNDKCKQAQDRACQVFQENLRRALLAPPRTPSTPLLSLDPGFQAGIKCAILNSNGAVVKLDTVKFLGKQRDEGIKVLTDLLLATQNEGKSERKTVLVVLGNGHGSQESRALIQDASSQINIPIDIQLVSEAGASVWSVTEAAKDEFPNEAAAAIAAISLGRRLQNPLHELVKVPPRSLGLGMYQHDLSESELDERLHLTSVDAVATVGVDINKCSVEILRKVPGLKSLADKVVCARPFKRRKDLLSVSGLGPKAFENCAAFCRVLGPDPLDATLVHPESYGLALWLLNRFSWKLSDVPSDIPSKTDMKKKWEKKAVEASDRFDVSSDRVFAVLENLVNSMAKIDPRLNGSEEPAVKDTAGSIQKCTLLPPGLVDMDKLTAAAPVRSIIGTVRNIADFGAFIDFGGKNDGLLHTSNLGPIKLTGLLIGQQLGVDIISVNDGKVSLATAGMNCKPNARLAKPRAQQTKRKRSMSAQPILKKGKRRRIDR